MGGLGGVGGGGDVTNDAGTKAPPAGDVEGSAGAESAGGASGEGGAPGGAAGGAPGGAVGFVDRADPRPLDGNPPPNPSPDAGANGLDPPDDEPESSLKLARSSWAWGDERGITAMASSASWPT